MPKDVSKPMSSILPSGTNVENLLDLINVLKKNSKNEESIKALFGKSMTVYNNTKAALKAFGIIEMNSLDFTGNIGREIAFSGDDNKKEEMTRIVKCYEPYELVLNSIVTSRADTEMTDIDTIKNLWGRADFGSGDRNRNEGATLFMSIFDYIGFGKYIIGRGNNSTRIEWVEDIKEKINRLNQESSITMQKENANEQENETIDEGDIDKILIEKQEDSASSVGISDKKDVKPIKTSLGIVNLPNININVDMSDWTDEKIMTFFKYAYGKFEKE